ncbi:3-methyladenine DNA glycosylase 2 [Pseudomonas protegens]|uniref:DNA-3-methyladenine glycosylase family protein n=1 Tax=Pseudomonas protegens TaxID=380021 RepID=UPI000F4C9755|nr:DNA-3-methyladenine glycosylase [Pseudomonas protegens]ROL73024.1 3-methyladenine DNA glycosylase 2 [Pseudomonas protegens]
MIQLLPYQGAYDWPAMLGFLRARAIEGQEVVQGDTYARTFALEGGQGILSVCPGPVGHLQVQLQVTEQALLPQVLARLRRQFDLDADLPLINRHLARDPLLAPLLAARPGLRVPGTWDGFELAIRAVLGQQITVQGAIRLAGKLVAVHGRPLASPDPRWPGLTHVFASPQVLAAADLGCLGMPRSRAHTLSAVARALLDDPQLFEPKASLQQGVERLRQLPGIGDWTAHYIALRQMREGDAFPAADVGLFNAVAHLEGRRSNARQLLARAEAWRPWRGYAAQHLWTAMG